MNVVKMLLFFLFIKKIEAKLDFFLKLRFLCKDFLVIENMSVIKKLYKEIIKEKTKKRKYISKT